MDWRDTTLKSDIFNTHLRKAEGAIEDDDWTVFIQPNIQGKLHKIHDVFQDKQTAE